MQGIFPIFIVTNSLYILARDFNEDLLKVLENNLKYFHKPCLDGK